MHPPLVTRVAIFAYAFAAAAAHKGFFARFDPIQWIYLPVDGFPETKTPFTFHLRKAWAAAQYKGGRVAETWRRLCQQGAEIFAGTPAAGQDMAIARECDDSERVRLPVRCLGAPPLSNRTIPQFPAIHASARVPAD